MSDFNNGDIVRFKSNGRTFTLDDINPNPDYEADDETWADGWNDGGSVEVLNPNDIELVMSAADAAKRKPPTPDEIAEEVSSSLHGGWGRVVDVRESDLEGDGEISVYGQTPEGLGVQFTVTISNVELVPR